MWTDLISIQLKNDQTSKIFLNQYTTQNITDHPDDLIYCAFLNHKGRVITDSYIFINDKIYIILPICQEDFLLKHLKKYAIFSKITIEKTNIQYRYSHEYGDILLPKSNIYLQIDQRLNFHSKTLYQDYIKSEIDNFIPRIRAENREKYTSHQLSLNDFSAISFTKGCYLGQEIAHRLEHRSKKRYFICSGEFNAQYNSNILNFCKTYNSVSYVIEQGYDIGPFKTHIPLYKN